MVGSLPPAKMNPGDAELPFQRPKNRREMRTPAKLIVLPVPEQAPGRALVRDFLIRSLIPFGVTAAELDQRILSVQIS